jgi:EAL domain-containing protein (putative c-di-GMP-specific phosphodiesterase class I)
VRGLLGSADEGRVVRSIRGIAERLDLATSVEGVEGVEGVEDQATLDLLRELGADYAQRFHVGRPVPLSRAQSSM